MGPARLCTRRRPKLFYKRLKQKAVSPTVDAEFERSAGPYPPSAHRFQRVLESG
jgi:hypothetical protein